MEDYFQIIIIAIFIISSIISSINKKKKQQAAKNNVPDIPSGSNAASKPTIKKKQKTSSEILEEMLGFKIEIPEPQKKEAPPIYAENDGYSSWDPSEEYEKVENSGLNNYQDKILAKKTDLEADKNKHKAFKDIVKKPKKNKAAKTKEKLFADKTSLKDYILIQEILNKPKALRK